jgi:hypothetical protein
MKKLILFMMSMFIFIGINSAVEPPGDDFKINMDEAVFVEVDNTDIEFLPTVEFDYLLVAPNQSAIHIGKYSRPVLQQQFIRVANNYILNSSEMIAGIMYPPLKLPFNDNYYYSNNNNSFFALGLNNKHWSMSLLNDRQRYRYSLNLNR